MLQQLGAMLPLVMLGLCLAFPVAIVALLWLILKELRKRPLD